MTFRFSANIIAQKQKITFSVVFFLICFLVQSAMALPYICSYCHKKIEAQWIEVDGNYYHPHHFLCANCLKPIGERLFFVHNDRYYDSTCFATFVTNRCDFCGKPILDEAVFLNSKTYHSSCYNESVGRRCVVCGQVVLEEFFTDLRGQAVCRAHKDNAERCSACQQFLSPKPGGSSLKLEDGRVICDWCVPSSVTDIEEANELIDEVRGELAKSGIIVKQNVKLVLVSVQELDLKTDIFPIDHLGVTRYEKSELLGGLFSFKKFEINVLYGLPRALLRSVLAHELMHVWLFTNSPQPQNQQMSEGTCQYAGYLVLRNDPSDEGRFFLGHLEEQDDEIYGEGFQKVWGYVKSVGLNAWLDYLKDNKDAPW